MAQGRPAVAGRLQAQRERDLGAKAAAEAGICGPGSSTLGPRGLPATALDSRAGLVQRGCAGGVPRSVGSVGSGSALQQLAPGDPAGLGRRPPAAAPTLRTPPRAAVARLAGALYLQ